VAPVSRLPYLDVPSPVAFAHRGGAATGTNRGIENSLEAFRDAVARGFSYLEMDVRCSADGTVWVIHDESLSRLTGSDIATASLDDKQLAQERMDGRASFVRLRDVLDDLPDVRFNIDIKAADAVEATCELIATTESVDRVCLTSFSYRRLRQIRRLLPDVVTGASGAEVALVKLMPAGLLGLLGLPRAACLQVPVASGHITVVTPRFIARARGLGLPIHVWTVDEASEMHRLLDLGVEGIITDRTDVLADVLAARGTPLRLSGEDIA